MKKKQEICVRRLRIRASLVTLTLTLRDRFDVENEMGVFNEEKAFKKW